MSIRGAETQEHWERRSHAVKKSHIQFMLQLKRKKSCRQGRRPSLHANIQLLACINPKQQPVSHSTFRHLVVYMLASSQSVCMQTSRCSHEIQTNSQSASGHPDTCMKAKQNSCQSVSLHAVCCMQAIQSCLHADLQPLACIHLKQQSVSHSTVASQSVCMHTSR